jgi:very-short-patch-repair endonuclease
MTLSEKRLWEQLRKLKLHIRRQAPIGRYVADFAQHAAAVVIEVDGGWHDSEPAQLRDAQRDQWMEGQGYRIIRVRDQLVFRDAEAVAERIGLIIKQRLERHPAALDWARPFPSMGKGRDGVEASASTGVAQGGAGADARATGLSRASTPTPAPPPLRGRGSERT